MVLSGRKWPSKSVYPGAMLRFPWLSPCLSWIKDSMQIEKAPVKPMPFCVKLCRKKRVYQFLRGWYFRLASKYQRWHSQRLSLQTRPDPAHNATCFQWFLGENPILPGRIQALWRAWAQWSACLRWDGCHRHRQIASQKWHHRNSGSKNHGQFHPPAHRPSFPRW